MKKVLFLLTLASALAVIPLRAGEKRSDLPYKYDFRLGWATIVETSEYGDLGLSMYSGALDSIYEDQNGPVYTAGGFSAEFGLDFRSWFTLAFNASASGIWYEAYSTLPDRRMRRSGAQISIMPVARFSWVRKRTFRMYSSLGLGAGLTVCAGKATPSLAVCFVPVGIQFGSKVYGFMEWGGGAYCSMQGVRGGVGIKF